MKSLTITLCGSARFERLYHLWNKMLTLSGHTVFGLGAYPSIEGKKDWHSPEHKKRLDQVHKLKIMRSDAIAVVSFEGYIGDSTRSEIQWALLLGKDVYLLENDKLRGLVNGKSKDMLQLIDADRVGNK